jgi:hypothetical protein
MSRKIMFHESLKVFRRFGVYFIEEVHFFN